MILPVEEASKVVCFYGPGEGGGVGSRLHYLEMHYEMKNSNKIVVDYRDLRPVSAASELLDSMVTKEGRMWGKH